VALGGAAGGAQEGLDLVAGDREADTLGDQQATLDQPDQPTLLVGDRSARAARVQRGVRLEQPDAIRLLASGRVRPAGDGYVANPEQIGERVADRDQRIALPQRERVPQWRGRLVGNRRT
jgi:hypothetical protein